MPNFSLKNGVNKITGTSGVLHISILSELTY